LFESRVAHQHNTSTPGRLTWVAWLQINWDMEKVLRGMEKWTRQETATKDAAINPGKRLDLKKMMRTNAGSLSVPSNDSPRHTCKTGDPP